MLDVLTKTNQNHDKNIDIKKKYSLQRNQRNLQIKPNSKNDIFK